MSARGYVIRTPEVERREDYAALLLGLARADPVEVHNTCRHLALNDLFFLGVYVLNRPDADNDWMFQRAREVQTAPNGYLDLWAREHGKSSVITNWLTIQDILNDPEMTFGIFSHTRPIAKQFLRQIKMEFERNEWLKELFPDVLWANPRKDSPKWSEDEGIVVRRKGNPKEATIEAWGLVDGQPTSKHFGGEGFAARYTRARDMLLDYWAEDQIDIADDGSNDWRTRTNDDGSETKAVDHDHIARSRLRIDTRKWLLSKLKPERYGDKLEVDTPKDGGLVKAAVVSTMAVAALIRRGRGE